MAIGLGSLQPELRMLIEGPGALKGQQHYVVKATQPTKAYLRDDLKIRPRRLHDSIAKGFGSSEVATLRNDVLWLSPDSHSLVGTALTWDKNMTHLIGMYPPAMQNQRSRIGHSATMATMLTVSGQGNLFANLYFMYGLANATDLNLMTVSGNRNTFLNCHFLPTNATPLDEAGYDLIRLNAAETYFKSCYFGGDTVPWSAGNMIEFWAGAEPPRVVFEDCMFVMNSDAAGVTFLKTLAGLGRCAIIFKNCQFLNLGTALTYAIDGAGLGNAKMLFDINCIFAGVTDIVAAGYESSVYWGHGGYVSADLLNNMIATNPDVS